MEAIHYILEKDLEPYVNCIMVQESSDPNGTMNLPLYADGYPGIMFQQTENGFFLLPKQKKLSELFLYGHTLEPISLDVKGPFRFVVVQLYPFACKYLLGIDPWLLNDECYDLLQLKDVGVESIRQALVATQTLDEQVKIISQLMRELIAIQQVPADDRVQRAIKMILDSKGQTSVRALWEELALTERTLERNFKAQVGLTPMQFAKIIQFQTSLYSLTQKQYDKLTDVGMDSGFSDQSHFIRTFKKYTGQTPSYYMKAMASH